MSRHDPLPPIGTGRISFGPVDEDGLVPRTLEFIRQQLPAWRDDPRRPKKVAEKGLNSSLCLFLGNSAKTHLPMVLFQHETLQTAGRTVDIGAHPAEEGTTIGTRCFSIYAPFLVVECKRLPTPGGKVREREYVSGFHSNGSPTGGIQRFKLGLHGGQVEVAAMIGYVEKHDFNHWHNEINQWIVQLVGASVPDGTTWTRSDQLSKLDQSLVTTASCDSEHSRIGNVISPVIQLRHIWVRM